MDTATILAALVTGATVALRETTEEAVKDAYTGLKSLVSGKFSVGSVSLLEKDPEDEDFKRQIKKEINLTPQLLEDPEVKQLIFRLYDAIEQHVPEQELKSIGVDAALIRSRRDTIIRGISGFDVGIRADKIESDQNTVIENISRK